MSFSDGKMCAGNALALLACRSHDWSIKPAINRPLNFTRSRRPSSRLLKLPREVGRLGGSECGSVSHTKPTRGLRGSDAEATNWKFKAKSGTFVLRRPLLVEERMQYFIFVIMRSSLCSVGVETKTGDEVSQALPYFTNHCSCRWRIDSVAWTALAPVSLRVLPVSLAVFEASRCTRVEKSWAVRAVVLWIFHGSRCRYGSASAKYLIIDRTSRLRWGRDWPGRLGTCKSAPVRTPAKSGLCLCDVTANDVMQVKQTQNSLTHLLPCYASLCMSYPPTFFLSCMRLYIWRRHKWVLAPSSCVWL